MVSYLGAGNRAGSRTTGRQSSPVGSHFDGHIKDLPRAPVERVLRERGGRIEDSMPPLDDPQRHDYAVIAAMRRIIAADATRATLRTERTTGAGMPRLELADGSGVRSRPDEELAHAVAALFEHAVSEQYRLPDAFVLSIERRPEGWRYELEFEYRL
jgi:hypothetical protein